jgi:hypothetical protein
MRKGYESYDNIVSRLISQTIDVYHEFTLIDNELPQLHTCVFQLGEDSESLYYWDGKTIKPTTLEAVNEIMKKPKPNMTITREQAKLLYAMIEHSEHYNITLKSKKAVYTVPDEVKKLREELLKFVTEKKE